MKKRIKRIILFVFVILLALLFSSLGMSFSFSSNKATSDYEYVMKGVINNNDAKVTDIAILGAHDAFSSDINRFSKPEKNDGGITTNKFLNAIAKGLVVRMSKAQRASAKEMLQAGVRYFDIRVSYQYGTYYCYHGYLSNPLEYYLKEVLEYLKDHNGEYLILDFQHFYTPNGGNIYLDDEEYVDLFDYIKEIKNSDGKSILDYVYYDSNVDALSSLTYGKLTNNGESAGVLILCKNDSLSFAYYRDKDASYKSYRSYYSIRSYWHETNSKKVLFDEIEIEYQYVKDEFDYDVLVINQAQLTGFIKNIKIVKSIMSWSIIDMAADLNKDLVSDKDRFMRWLDEMPIFMVDNVTSNKGDFNKKAIEYICEFNGGL